MTKLIITLFMAIVLSTNGFAQSKPELKTVKKVDVQKYSGKWYEIARYPNKFQKKCVGNTTATYKIKSVKTLEVVNECLEKDGKTDRAKGKARIVDTESNSKLEVRFAPAFLSFLSAVWGDYWIIDLGENYEFAAIGDPKREYFWILGRNPKMDDKTYQGILDRAEAQGFDPKNVNKTPQNVAVVNGEVVQK